jgi:hypothetical protein
MPLRRELPLPAFVMHPFTLLVLAGVHVYLAFVHLAQLAAGNIEWTHFWKGFGALAGAYVFLALTSRASPDQSCGNSPGRVNKRLQRRVLIGRDLAPIAVTSRSDRKLDRRSEVDM